MRYSAPRGTNDILPDVSWRWQTLEDLYRQCCVNAGFNEIRTPVFEETDLFHRSIGEITDVVSKEMYTFVDRGDRSVTLRPEGTAPVVRAWVEHNLGAEGLPTKLFYAMSFFRYERPQAGRYRQFHQFGTEVIGSDDPTLDAEVIALADRFFKAVGISGQILQINSVGIPESRQTYIAALKDHVKPFLSELCKNCQERFEKNPLRMLDCKVPSCIELTANVPHILDFLDEASAAHFQTVLQCLDALKISYSINHRLVRGFDYYTNTIFEFQIDSLGAQNTICGGGRYDKLVEQIGGIPQPAVGFGMGIERLLLALDSVGTFPGNPPTPVVFVVRVGEGAQVAGLQLAEGLRSAGISTEMDYGARSMKAQMKKAGKSAARITLILGDDELSAGQVTARDMAAQQQWRLPLQGCAMMIKDYLATAESDKIANNG